MINIVTVQLACVVFHLSVSDATDMKCPLNMTLFTLPDGSQDCDMCRICPPGLIEVKPCGYRKDPVCICKDGSYRDHLYNCWPCSSCQKDQYIKAPCSRTEDVVCGNCTHCGDRGEITHCSATNDTVCSDAGDGVLKTEDIVVTTVVVIAAVVVVIIVVVICIRRGCRLRHNYIPKSNTHSPESETPHVEENLAKDTCHNRDPKSITPGLRSKGSRNKKRQMTTDAFADLENKNLLELRNIVEVFYSSVGALVHNDRVITVFRVGPKYVMTAYSAVKDLIGSNGCFEITFDECPKPKNTYQIRYPSFYDTDIDVAVFCIFKTTKDLPEPIPMCEISDRSTYQKLEFLSFENETKLQRLHICQNEVLMEGKPSYEDALKLISNLQKSVSNTFSPTKNKLRKKLLDKSLEELKDGTVYVWKSSIHKLSSPGTPGFTKYGERCGVVCMFTHAWPLRDDFIQSQLPVGTEWYAGPSMAAVYEKIKGSNKDLAEQLFALDDL